jgi:thymidylate synthase ThyX
MSKKYSDLLEAVKDPEFVKRVSEKYWKQVEEQNAKKKKFFESELFELIANKTKEAKFTIRDDDCHYYFDDYKALFGADIEKDDIYTFIDILTDTNFGFSLDPDFIGESIFEEHQGSFKFKEHEFNIHILIGQGSITTIS